MGVKTDYIVKTKCDNRENFLRNDTFCGTKEQTYKFRVLYQFSLNICIWRPFKAAIVLYRMKFFRIFLI